MMTPKSDANRRLYRDLVAGDTAALSYALSALENKTPAGAQLHRLVRKQHANVPVVGFTGPPGVGKSTLINAYIHVLRKCGKRVAVIAVDPSSPNSGGAILGDRFRMDRHSNDPGVFVRSVSSRGHPGGLCSSIFGMIGLLDAAGWEAILLETVGAGQSDTDLADIADIRIVVQAPGLGDDLQAIKSGILEIADIVVVNKADLPLSHIANQRLEAINDLRQVQQRGLPILKTVATTGEGLDRLQETIEALGAKWETAKRGVRYTKRMHRFFAREVGRMTEQALACLSYPELTSVYEHYLSGKGDLKPVVDSIVRSLLSQLAWEGVGLSPPDPNTKPRRGRQWHRTC